ncbi:MAG: glycosyltransferase [Planctomycetota bacterium]
MKIVFVTMQFGRSYVQGTERYVGSLGRCLRDRGHAVNYLAGDPLHLDSPRKLGHVIDADEKIYAYPTRGWMSVVGLSPKRIAQWLKKQQPDIVHINTPAHIGVAAMLACRKLGIPCVVTVHDFWWVCPKGTLLRGGKEICDGTPPWYECVPCISADHPKGWVRMLSRFPAILSPLPLLLYFTRAGMRKMSPADMYRWTQRRSVIVECLNLADRMIFPSEMIGRVISPWLSHKRWQVIPNGLQKHWFADPRAKTTKPRTPEDLTIGYAGAMAAHKAPHLLLEAVKHLGWTGTRVRLAGPQGDANYLEQLEKSARGLKVEFLGRLSVEEMPAFLRTLDIFAMTSIWPENCPYAVLEAQAAGVPVVGSNIGGVPELIGDERLMFQPGSAEGLARALTYVCDNPQYSIPTRVHTVDEMTDKAQLVYQAAIQRCRGL